MAVPTVSSITPNVGLTGGHVLTTIIGTGFRLPTVPPATGRPTVGKPPPSVRVTFIGSKMSRAAPKVYVLATTQLLVEVPPMDPEFVDPTLPEASLVSAATAVKVENIDDDGLLIGAETVTASAGYTFRRPDLAALANGDDSNLVKVVRALLKDLKRQVHPNVYMTVHTDYDASVTDQLNIIEDAKLPAVIIIGPTLRENRLYSLNAPRRIDTGVDGVFHELRTPKTVDLEFDVLAASDATMELLAMMELLTQYFQRNTNLRVIRTKGSPELGEVEYEMEIVRQVGDFGTADRANESNLRQFGGRAVVRGVDLDEADMVILKTKTLADYVPVGADSVAVTPSPVILGTDVSATPVTIGQGGPGPTGGATSPPPDDLDFEQFQGD